MKKGKLYKVNFLARVIKDMNNLQYFTWQSHSYFCQWSLLGTDIKWSMSSPMRVFLFQYSGRSVIKQIK